MELTMPNAVPAADTGLPKFISRRTALKSAALAAVLPSTAIAFPEPEDPILPVYRDWCAARIEWNRYADLPGNENWDRPESIAAQEREDAAFWKMVEELVPTSLEGIGSLTHVLWAFAGPCLSRDEDEAAEFEDPKDRLMIKIWQAATGETAPEPDRHLS
jgi:hypothetical protein